MVAPERLDLFVLESSPNRELNPSLYLADYLSHVYLAEPARKNPALREIPYVLEEILAPILTRDYISMDEENHLRAELVGSIPKYMAGEVNTNFWKYPQFFTTEAEKELDEETYDILKYLIHGPADIDIKIHFLGQGGYSTLGYLLAHSLIERYVGEGDEFEAFLSNGRVVYRGFQVSGFDIEVSFGPIPTNPKKQSLEIKFFDPQDARKVVFLCHIGDLPTEARDALADKRLETNDKQDFGTAYLESDGENLTYSLSEKAIEVMDRQDKFVDLEVLKTKTVGELAEVGMRALRMNLLHPFMDCPAGTADVGLFFPLIESGSIFDFRKAIQAVAGKETLPEYVKPIIVRELFLCLTVNPYLTVQFLKDSGLGRIIPGLTHLALEDWNQLLNSHKMALALDRTKKRIVLPGKGYLGAQIKEYQGRGLMDGVERFVSALEELRPPERSELSEKERASCWSKLLGFFKEKDKVDEDKEEDREELTGGIIGRKSEADFRFVDGAIPFTGKGDVVGVVDDGSGRIFTLIGTDAVDSDSRQSFLKNMRRAFGRKDSLVKEKGGIEPNFAFIKKIIESILDFPGGLTARELSVLTTGERTGQQFAEQFLLLKMAGVILRYPVYRYDRKGDLARTDFYGLRQNFRQINLLTQLTEPGSQKGKRFRAEFRKLTGSDKGFKYVRALVRKRDILTIEALQSLTEEDFELMGNVPYMGADVESCYSRASAIVEAFRQIEGEKF